jgi:hypothetical protein
MYIIRGVTKIWLFLASLTVVISALLLVSCQSAEEPQATVPPDNSCPTLNMENQTMDLTKDGTVSKATVPVIDASMPARTATATFALG